MSEKPEHQRKLSKERDDDATLATNPDKPGSGLSQEERQEAREAVRQRPAVVYETIRIQGENELRRPASALWWSGVAAGISMGFSFLAEAVLAAHLQNSAIGPVIAKLGYSVGFLIVILAQQQLFTENVLTAVLPVMARKEFAWLKRMLRLWGIVLAANLLGCSIFALALSHLPVVDPDVTGALGKIIDTLMSNTALETFAKSIGAGWLIAALVWILASAEDSAFLIITLLTSLIALFGFTHIVAGSVEAFYGVFIGKLQVMPTLLKFWLPTLAGNVFGGTVLFSVLSHAQVREEIYANPSG